MKQLYDVNSAARFWSISPWTVRSYIRNGKLKVVRIGRRVLLEEAELERFITSAKAPDGDELDQQAPEAAQAILPNAAGVEGGERD